MTRVNLTTLGSSCYSGISKQLFGADQFVRFVVNSQFYCVFRTCGMTNYVFEQLKVVCELIINDSPHVAQQKLLKVIACASIAFLCGVLSNATYQVFVCIVKKIEIRAKSPKPTPKVLQVSDWSAEEILKFWCEQPSNFAALSEQEQYLCKRAVSKEFTEHVLKAGPGSLFNKFAIWECATFGAEMISRLTGVYFNLAAVGSYSVVLQHDTQDQLKNPLQEFAVKKRESGTDLDCKCIGFSKFDHGLIYQRICNFIYTDYHPSAIIEFFAQFTTRLPLTQQLLAIMDRHPITFCTRDFNAPTNNAANFFIARKDNGTKTNIRSFLIPGLDPRIKLSATHVCCEDKEFIVFRFKYARQHVTPDGTRITAKVCFLDISICKAYDPSYTCDRIPKSFPKMLKQTLSS